MPSKRENLTPKFKIKYILTIAHKKTLNNERLSQVVFTSDLNHLYTVTKPVNSENKSPSTHTHTSLPKTTVNKAHSLGAEIIC